MQLKYASGLVIVTITGLLSGQQKALTIEKVESLVTRRNLELIALSKEIKASEGSLLQKSLRINPELDIEPGAGVDPETVVQLNQTFELGGKRLKRTKVGELELEKTDLDYQVRRLEILKEARGAFIDVLVNQEMINLIQDRIGVSKEFLSTVRKKVVAGRLSPAEESRARVMLVSEEIKLSRARRVLRNSWMVLASFWGSTTPEFDIAIGDLDVIDAMPPRESLRELVEKSPLMTRAEMDITIQESVVTLENANRIPDLVVGPGLKRTDIPGNTYEFGVSIALPFFNRNQGAIIEANARLNQAMDNKQVVDVHLKTAVQNAYSELEIAYHLDQSFKETILPEAGKAYQVINEGYLQGKFDYLDVVDAQNTLFEARENLLMVLSDYHAARFELESLLGQSLDAIKK